MITIFAIDKPHGRLPSGVVSYGPSAGVVSLPLPRLGEGQPPSSHLDLYRFVPRSPLLFPWIPDPPLTLLALISPPPVLFSFFVF